MLILFIHYNYNILFNKRYVLAFDVGQGDSTLLHIDNKTILIVGLLLIAMISIILKEKDLALAVSGGLVGYLSKDITQKKQ